MKINIESTVEKFEQDFLSGSLKKDDLENYSDTFFGKVEQQEYEQFETFVETPLFKKILDL